MKGRFYIVITLVIAFTGLLVFNYRHGKSGGSDTADSPQNLLAMITTAHPSQHTFRLKIPWTGRVETHSSVELKAHTAGRVESVDASDQQYIEKGRPVIRLGGFQIEDTLAGLKIEIESLTTEADLAGQTLKRLNDNLKTHLASNAQVSAARAEKTRLDARLNRARLNMKLVKNRSNITAPISGIFTNRRVSTGQEVMEGQIVGEIINTDRLRIIASLFPPEGTDIQEKEATIYSAENLTLKGTVYRALPRALATGAISVWIEGSEVNERFHPGQMVRGDIIAAVRADALAVPESAVVYDSEEHPFVFVTNGDTYKAVGIRTGLEQDGRVEILSGIKEEQLVVTHGAYELFYRNFNEQFKVQD